jgi:hypothetical protein
LAPPQGASWLRCQVHSWQRISLGAENKPGDGRLNHPHDLRQPELEDVNTQLEEVTRMLHKSHAKVAGMFIGARCDLLALVTYPRSPEPA